MTPPNVLIVEDKLVVASNLSDRLSDLGYSVAGVAASGIEAIQMVSEQSPDIILMDIKLSQEMDGVQAAEEIRSFSDVPIIYLTAHVDDTTVQRAKLTAPYGYLLKPFNLRELHSTMEMALYRYEMEARLRESEREHRDLLEARVAERTEELAQTNRLLREEIAERKLVEESLRQHDRGLQLLGAAVEQSADGVIITDSDEIILYANPAFEQLTGYSRAEALGKTPDLFGSGQHSDEFYDELWRVIRAGQVWRGRLINKKKEGPLVPVDATISPIRDPQGDIVNYVATMRDFTRESKLEEQIRRSQRVEALGRLAGGIAHDFNNLLTVIELGTTLMERRLGPDDSAWHDLQQIRQTIKRASNLTRRLLNLSRQEPGEPRSVSLSELGSNLLWVVGRIVDSNVELSTGFAQDLWRIDADPTQMEQVFINLIVNARDAMPEGGHLQIETSNAVLDEAYALEHLDAKPGPYVKLTVTDTGCGMSEEVKARIFEPFFSTKSEEGHGMGLATVFGIVQERGGHIRVLSQVGKGTTFHLYLPASPGSHESPAEQTAVAPRMDTRGTETILVVEDEDFVRDLTVHLLESFGYKVQAATDGHEAVEMCEQGSRAIDLLLTDLMLPKMGGWELSQRLQDQHPDIQVLFMSGYGDDSSVVRQVLDAGQPLLVKPYDIDNLAETVRLVLDGGAERAGK